MLMIDVISTGSLGNSYILYYNNNKLIIDFGLPYRNILVHLDNANNTYGICSHFHLDHNYKTKKSTTIEEFNKLGIKILTPFNTEIGKKYKLGCFDIIPLPAIHNTECRAYLIQVDNNNILFATDTNLLPKINVKIDYFIVEVNYINRIREKALLLEEENWSHLKGIYYNHHSLENAIEYFSNLNYKPKKILTIHKSNSGLFFDKEVLNCLSPFAENVFIASNGKKYVLEEI